MYLLSLMSNGDWGWIHIAFAAFVGIAVGSQAKGPLLTFVILAFSVAVVLGWAWVSAMAARLLAKRALAKG